MEDLYHGLWAEWSDIIIVMLDYVDLVQHRKLVAAFGFGSIECLIGPP